MTKSSAKEILRIGIPSGLNNMVVNFANVAVQSAVNSFNNTALMAAKTVVSDLLNMLIQALHAFALGCVSFAGQCFGAKKYKRIDRLAITTVLCGGGMVLVEALLVTAFPDAVIGIFNSDPEVLEVGRNLLLINAWGYLLNAVGDVYLNCSKGMGKSVGPTLVNVLGNMLPRVLWVWLIFPMNRTMEWLYLCFPLAWLINSVAQVCYYVSVRKKLDRQLALETAQ